MTCARGPGFGIRTLLMAVGVLSWPTIARAQTIAADSIRIQSAPPLPAQKIGKSIIRGRVAAADTGRPLRRARVTLRSLDPAVAGQTVTTDSDGRFEFTGLPAARYTVAATRSGYLTLSFGQSRPLESGKPIQVADNQLVDDLTFALPPMSVVGGRIADEAGEPMAGVRVLLMRSSYVQGQRRFDVSASGSTDDEGRYLVENVSPGTYVVLASLQQTWRTIEDGVEQTVGYSPTYYPGTASLASAGRVTVAVFEESTAVDFAVVRGRVATVSGTAMDSQGRPLTGQTVYASQEFRNGATSTTLQAAGTAIVDAEGRFTIRDLAPGDYKLVMRDVIGTGNNTHVEEAGVARISLNGDDIRGVPIVTSRGWSISGKATTDRGPLPDALRTQFSIVGSPVIEEADLKVGGIDGSGMVAEDGAFWLAGLFGRTRIRANLPPDWMLKAVIRDGRDVTDEPIEARSGQQTSPFELILTDRITSITGQVTDDKNRPVADGNVIVFPRDADKWSDDARYLRTVRSDQQGRFEIRRLPAGDYLAVAVVRLLEGQWNDPEYLDQIRRYGERVQLADGDARAIALKVIDP